LWCWPAISAETEFSLPAIWCGKASPPKRSLAALPAPTLAVRNGYPASYFVAFPNDSKSTASESAAIISELRKLRVHKIDLVTSNFHTRRAARIFRSQAPDIELHTVAAPDRYFTPNGWWKEREGRKTFLMEWAKTVGAWFDM
jgi:uncharacterized SAM-binding protein YcdF (DUF218 family)